MARKTNTAKPDAPKPDAKKQAGTLIRVSDDFAATIKRAAGFEDASIAEFADRYLSGVVEDRYRDALAEESRRIGKRGGA